MLGHWRIHVGQREKTITWPNGARATLFNATEPDQLRGPQHSLAWCDELAKWQYAEETWDQLQFGMRLGKHPRQIVATTPRPIPVLKRILGDHSTVTTRGLLNSGNGLN
jgi:phage terminase large subunit-like protein